MNVVGSFFVLTDLRPLWGAAVGLCEGFLLVVERQRYHQVSTRFPLVIGAIDTDDSET